MIRLPLILLATCVFGSVSILARGDDPKRPPGKTIEVTRKAGKVVFTEKGKLEAKPTAVVLGETVRWVNCDDRPLTVKSVVEVGGKRLFETEVIPPGEHRDVRFNIDMYEKAGGRTARSVALKYQVNDQAEYPGELMLLSPARR